MSGDEARRLIEEAIAALLLRGGGTPDGCRAVVERDNVTDPDRWQGWFRGATGLPVLVSTETVFLIERRADEVVAGVVVQLPVVLRMAVTGAAAPGASGLFDVPCPDCGAVRRCISRSDAKQRARMRCRVCHRRARASLKAVRP